MENLQQRLNRLSPVQRAQLLARLKGAGLAEREDVTKATQLPAVEADVAGRYDPFPLTDLQQAYWIGRNSAFEIGDIASHCYLEIEGNFDIDRLSSAWRTLIQRHDMLRAVILDDGRQQVLREVPPYVIQLEDLGGLQDAAKLRRQLEVRDELSHQVLPSDRWPLFEIRALRTADDRVRLCISLDALIVDGWSLFLLFSEWAELYHDDETEPNSLDLTFRDYVLAERKIEETESFRQSKEYWRKRLETFPSGPELPLARSANSMDQIRFERHQDRLEPEVWTRLKSRASEVGLTPTGILLAAYAEVIALWSRTQHFTLSVPRFNRIPLHPDVNRVVGEAASFTLLEVDATAGNTFSERARIHQQQLWEDLDHAEYNGLQVLRDLAQTRADRTVHTPVIFTAAPHDSEHGDAYITTAANKLGEVVFAINQTSQVWLDNHVSEQAGALVCDWDCVTGLFPEGMAEAMLASYFAFLRRLANEAIAWEERRSEIHRSLLPVEQLRRREESYRREPALDDRLLHDPLLDQFHARPDAKAVVTPDRTLTYGQLDDLTRRWAARLREQGARPNTFVAIVMEKGWEQVVAAIAVLRSGAAYQPIDAGSPDDRLQWLLANSGASVALTQSWVHQRVNLPHGVHCMRLDVDDPGKDPGPIESLQGPDDLSHLIYTSGSTGLPKGTMIAHRGLRNALVCTSEEFSLGPDDKVLAVTALHHDMSIFDVFGVLGVGGTVVIPAPSGRRDPAHWSELMNRERVTLWNSVPAMMEMLLEYADGRSNVIQDSLRLVFLGGDWLNVDLPTRLRSHVQGARVVSVGGPTETSLWNIWYPVEELNPNWTSIPYGRPIAHTRYHILNDAMENCPDWVPGEMCVEGVGVARGYWHDSERTAEKFVVHPRTGARLYRTGDIGRYLPDSLIEFLGRVDFQVKINGQRIELGEIEATLQQHAKIRTTVVSAVGESRGKKRLVAYVVPSSNDQQPDQTNLRQYLSEKLPEHMIPSAFVTLQRLPLTANGKIDRKALPAPDEAEPKVTPDLIADNTRPKIIKIVAEVLSLTAPDPNANLLSMGANSIDMVRIGNQLEKTFGFRPRMDEIFRLQTIDAMSAYFQERLGESAKQTKPVSTSASEETIDGPLPEIRELLKSTRVMIDPEERNAFKNSRPGVRRDLSDKQATALDGLGADAEARYRAHRSHRVFSLKPIPFEDISRFLGCMAEMQLPESQHKFLYASPGGLNPTQVYLHFKPGRVQGIKAGTYYYDPEKHSLVSLVPGAVIQRDIHIPFINTPIYDQAAFSMFIVAQMKAIVPAYGTRSMHFVTLEAGILSQLLETAGPPCRIGLCQVGTLEFDRIRSLFLLDEGHVLIHPLLGGAIDPEFAQAWPVVTEGDDADKAAKLLWRIERLSDEDVQTLLAAELEQRKMVS